jgi:hypothetical protein
MVNFSNVWAVASVERRHTRRLARYWVFLAVAYLAGIGGYVYYSVLHAFFSSLSATVGVIGPRYLVGAIGLNYLAGFVLGIVFLGFDVRARDLREGIAEVLDARPLTNFELVTGRFVALFLSAWIPIVVLAVLIQGLGWLLPLLGSPVGSTVEPLSLVNFAVFMAVPGLAFAIGLVFVITLLVRHRLIAALVAIAAIVGLFWALFSVPATLGSYFDFFGMGHAASPSDFVPTIGAPAGWLHRAGVLVLAFGLVGIAAAIHPRLDAHKSWAPFGASAALVVAGFAAVASVVQMRVVEAARTEQWRVAHEARVAEPVVDLVSIDGTFSIDPGRNLAADLVVELQAPPDQTLSRVLLTLNPGLRVEAASAADGTALRTEHADGLLDISLNHALAPGERASLRLRYGGLPNTTFGYLDGTLNLETATAGEAQVALLGHVRGIFDRRYVALMPGVRWLPAAGADVGRDDPRTRRTDYFKVALDVELPSAWLAAGPSKRQLVRSEGGRTTFRFAPQPAVPEVALLAGELESFATEIDGITFEVLVHPDHDRNFEVLAEARAEIEQWIAERLELARDAGLDYPFDAFTAVEVPNTLRSYEGGWRADTALAPPAMMLLRETSFPTARFDFDASAVFGNRNYDQEGGKPRIDRDRVLGFFSNDLSGGNILAGAARSFFVHRTSATGPEAIALDFLLEDLSTLLVSGQRSYFSAHLFNDLNQAVVNVMTNLQGASGISDAAIRGRTARADVWNTALETPLAALDPHADPQRAIDTLTLKGGELAEVIRDRLGPNGIGQVLAQIVERHSGGSFSLSDFVAASDSVSAGTGPLIEDWIGGTALPGFIVRSVEQYRLPDDENGASRYQLLVRLANEEPVVGFARISWAVLGRGNGGVVFANPGQNPGSAVGNASAVVSRSEPIRFEGNSAVEFGVVLSVPATNVRVLPYLSLNRDDFVAAELRPGEPPRRAVEPFDGYREIAFDSGRDDRIVADDLDEGFEIVNDTAGEDLRLGGQSATDQELDQGLPIATSPLPNSWSRRAGPAAWGRYRHTFASIRAGQGTTRAVMPVVIPAPGVWELEIHLPVFNIQSHRLWSLEIVSADGRESVEYNAATASAGWNLVGEYRLPAGEVRVELSDRAESGSIVADAIGWSPVRTFEAEGASAQ